MLFCDLIGFTDYTEKLRPDQMVEIISEFFREMTEQVFAHQGTLKEYVGDQIMAIFGAPVAQEDHARRACQSALAMQRRLAELREDWPRRGWPPLRARVGVNSGRMLVGNLGSVYRFSYGVLGDNVNLGSRLEGLNKLYGTDVIVGERTAAEVGGRFRLRLLDWVRVKGREAPESIYELLGESGVAFEASREEALRRYAEALAVYRDGRWPEARALFEAAARDWPQGKASRIMADRCKYFLANPLDGGWDGVFRERRK